MATITPSNGGVLLEVSRDVPRSMLDEDKPRSGYVMSVGGGVRWLKPGQCVIYDQHASQEFEHDRALIDQRHILGIIDGVFRAPCPNGCTGRKGCSSCPPGRHADANPS